MLFSTCTYMKVPHIWQSKLQSEHARGMSMDLPVLWNKDKSGEREDQTLWDMKMGSFFRDIK